MDKVKQVQAVFVRLEEALKCAVPTDVFTRVAGQVQDELDGTKYKNRSLRVCGKEAVKIIKDKCKHLCGIRHGSVCDEDGDDCNIKDVGEFAIKLNKRKVKFGI